jgi:Arc/MetJ-type ribon-helix-helix transcriptional regulator
LWRHNSIFQIKNQKSKISNHHSAIKSPSQQVLLPHVRFCGKSLGAFHKSSCVPVYCYHLATENHIAPHHWTEKLSDAFLGHCLPFYFGCPNAEDYFPADSFIRIDIHRLEQSVARIKQALADGEYEKRLHAIREARRRVLEDYGIFTVVSRIICERHDLTTVKKVGEKILSRRALSKSSLGNALSYSLEKIIARSRHRWARFRQ